jgi:hypothetical protein
LSSSPERPFRVRAFAIRCPPAAPLGVDAVPALAGAARLECAHNFPATARSAVISDAGKARSRLAARRRIPAAAFGLKQYLSRCGPVSKTSDNDDATAPLRDSEVLSVQNSVGDPIPEFSQRPEDGAHCPPVEFHAPAGAAGSSPNNVRVGASGAADSESRAGADRRQEARDVLQEEPPGPKIGSEANDLPEESRACATQAETTSRQADVLTGPASGDESSLGIKA